MTFAAMAAWQAWVLLAGAAALAAGLFLVRLRPPRTIVPSLLFWRRVLDQSREQTLWERIRRAVSLAVTVLVALMLALAAARPAGIAGTADRTDGRMLIVMDASWSMQARTPTGETRWQRAGAEARRLLAAAAGREVALATTADGLVEGPTTDSALVEGALERIAPSGSDVTAWPRLAGAAVHFITDGAAARLLDADVVIHSVFEPAPNVAITAFAVRPSLAADTAGDAYLEIANFAPEAQNVRVTLLRGPSAVFDRRFDVRASGLLRQAVPIARGDDATLRVRIAAAHDALALDDEAVAWLDRAQPLSVTVVGAETGWLRAAFEGDRNARARFVGTDVYGSGPAGLRRQEDVLVFDRWAPAEPPRRPAILFAPPPDTPWLAGTLPGAGPDAPAGTSARDERRPRWEGAGRHRVVRGVDPHTLVIERARAYSSPSLVPIAESARGTPLIAVSESPDLRFVVVGFGHDDSNLASAPGFPVLLANAIEWLAGPAATTHPPGLVAFDPAVTSVRDPSGDPVPLVRVSDRALGILRAPGLYVTEGGGARGVVAVNAGDAHLSNLMRTTTTASAEARTVAAGASGRPWWIYCAMAAFLLALAEWWTWQRRITV